MLFSVSIIVIVHAQCVSPKLSSSFILLRTESNTWPSITHTSVAWFWGRKMKYVSNYNRSLARLLFHWYIESRPSTHSLNTISKPLGYQLTEVSFFTSYHNTIRLCIMECFSAVIILIQKNTPLECVTWIVYIEYCRSKDLF